ACRMGGAPAEMAGRIERLMRIKAGEEKAGRFSVCDDATSGFLAGRCAVHAQRIVRADREMRFAALAAQLGEREKPAFAQLRAAAEIYANKSAGGEIDRSGTMRVAFVVARQAEVLSGFTTLLFALEDRRTPRPGVSFVDIDARLNTIYQGIMASAFPPSGIPGGIERNGIRNAERAWIAYRDSWVAFAMARYPWLDSSLLKAHLTEERVAFLENIEAMVD
uniref:lysozyme inhibitor LprI family protein n=1 Tax=Roseovarius sp. TaxID=1486281 RepID=UPI003564175F